MISPLWSLIWAAPFIPALSASRRKPDLNDYPPAADGKLSVIIPARNEAGNIATVLDAVTASAYPDLEIVVVDDRSTDATADIVRRVAAKDPRVRLIPGQELPAGWYGKPWACLQGARASSGRYLLFTDADTRHHPTLIGRAVSAMMTEKPGLLTVAPRQLCLTFWERVVMPQVWLLLGIRYHPARVNHATKSRDIIANGQFILMQRESYQAIGTHEAVKGEVAEDLALAQTAHRKGQRVWFAFAENLMETRMYDGLRPMIEGWSKNLYLGGRRSFPDQPLLQALVPLSLSIAMLFWLIPPVALAVALVAAPWLLNAALVATGICIVFWSGVVRAMQIPLIYALAYPAGSVMALYILLRSTWRGGKRIEWRGRTYEESGAGTPTSLGSD
ncbi:MAG TPA: glycosyltransferase [Gemmatimonadales bacterium]|nr:glycosyltransferase [Gemmatimonadales bacterium]